MAAATVSSGGIGPLCRGLYALRFDERLSKRAAAAWAQQEFPQWADLICRALGWRQRQHDPDGQDGAATLAETRSFVTEMAKLALQWCRSGPEAPPPRLLLRS